MTRARSNTVRRRLAALLAVLIALKCALVIVDGNPSAFMGDTGAYLYTALHGYLPHDRGFFYGFLLRPLAIWPHSLRFLVFAQAAMSAVSAWLIAVNLTRVFAIPFRWAALASSLCALEPLQLLSERYIMTDTTALFVFAILVTTTLSFIQQRTGIRLALVLFIGAVLIGIRISYLPLVLLNSVVLPILWYRRRFVLSKQRLRLTAALLLWFGLGQLFLYGYRRLNAAVLEVATPEYFYTDGFILLADVAPLVTAADFPDGVPGRKVLREVEPSLTDPELREAQIFAPNGLRETIRRMVVDDEYQANRLAKRIALSAIRNHPLSLARLAIHTWTEFFDIPQLQAFLLLDEGGIRATDQAFREEIRQSLGTDLAAPSGNNLIRIWHRAAIPWYWFVLAMPLGIPFLLLGFRRRIDAPVALIGCYSMIFFAQNILFVTHAIPRYLMGPAWLTFLWFGAFLSLISRTTDAPADLPESGG